MFFLAATIRLANSGKRKKVFFMGNRHVLMPILSRFCWNLNWNSSHNSKQDGRTALESEHTNCNCWSLKRMWYLFFPLDPVDEDNHILINDSVICLFIYLYTYLFIASSLDVLNVIFWVRDDHSDYYSELFFELILN